MVSYFTILNPQKDNRPNISALDKVLFFPSVKIKYICFVIANFGKSRIKNEAFVPSNGYQNFQVE